MRDVQLFAVVTIVLVVVFAGLVYWLASKPVSQTIIPVEGGNGGGDTELIVSGGACDMQAQKKPEIRFSIANPLNSTGTEYVGLPVRIYDVTGGTEVFKDTVNALTTGFQSISSGFACDCDHSYKLYVAAIDANTTSGVFNAACSANDNTYEYTLPQQKGMIFKVYDETAKAWVYAASELTAGSFQATGTEFYSTSSNSTGTTIGTDGYFIYDIYFEENATAAIDTQFEDQSFGIGINAGNLSEWGEPTSMYIPGAAVTKLATVPSKIASDGYDFFYEVAPMHVGTSQKILTMEMHAKSGQNPGSADKVTVGFFTKGYFKKTLSSAMDLGYTKDDSSSTYVFTAQTVLLNVA